MCVPFLFWRGAGRRRDDRIVQMACRVSASPRQHTKSARERNRTSRTCIFLCKSPRPARGTPQRVLWVVQRAGDAQGYTTAGGPCVNSLCVASMNTRWRESDRVPLCRFTAGVRPRRRACIELVLSPRDSIIVVLRDGSRRICGGPSPGRAHARQIGHWSFSAGASLKPKSVRRTPTLLRQPPRPVSDIERKRNT